MADSLVDSLPHRAVDADTTAARGWRALSRGQAFAIHLSLSLLAFSTLVGIMLLYWFPGELFFIDGGIQGLKIVALVDLVLGPLLTLMLFKPGKPKLAMDMAMIAAIQIAALAYGFHTTYQQRTLALVYADGAFQTVSGKAHEEANAELRELDREPQQLESAGLLRMNKVITPAPGPGEFGSYLAELLNGWPEPHERSDQYVAFEHHYDSIRARALDRAELDAMAIADAVETSLAALDRKPEDVDIHRYKTRFSSGVAIVDVHSLEILDYVQSDTVDADTDIADTNTADTDTRAPTVAEHAVD